MGLSCSYKKGIKVMDIEGWMGKGEQWGDGVVKRRLWSKIKRESEGHWTERRGGGIIKAGRKEGERRKKREGIGPLSPTKMA